MDAKTKVAVLKGARSLLEKGWVKGSLARNSKGESVDYASAQACGFCVMGGALRHISDQRGFVDHYSNACNILEPVFGISPVSLNDDGETKHLHVMMGMDFAVLMAEDELKAAKKAAKK